MLGLTSFSDAANVLRALSHSQAVIEFDLTGRILSANTNFCSAMGYGFEEIRGQHHSLFCDPATVASPAYKAFWAGLAAGRFDAGAYRRVGKGGREVWIQATYNPVFSGSKPYKVIKLAADITAAKHAAIEDAGKLGAISRSQAVIEFTPAGRSSPPTRTSAPRSAISSKRLSDVTTGSSASATMWKRRSTRASGPALPAASSLPANSSASPRTAARSGSRLPITRSSMPMAR